MIAKNESSASLTVAASLRASLSKRVFAMMSSVSPIISRLMSIRAPSRHRPPISAAWRTIVSP